MRRASRDAGLILAVAGVVALTFVVAELRVAGELGLPLDDSWIHLRFADNVAAGSSANVAPSTGPGVETASRSGTFAASAHCGSPPSASGASQAPRVQLSIPRDLSA